VKELVEPLLARPILEDGAVRGDADATVIRVVSACSMQIPLGGPRHPAAPLHPGGRQPACVLRVRCALQLPAGQRCSRRRNHVRGAVCGLL
jgi:hypothetical protein